MKNKFIVLTSGIILALILGLTGCSNDPAKEEIFMGEYQGLITYGSIDGGLDIKTNDTGTVKVTKVGNSYTFVFSDGIPSLTNLKFEKRDDTADVYKGEGLNKITITKNKLNIFFNKDGKNWTANCTRETED